MSSPSIRSLIDLDFESLGCFPPNHSIDNNTNRIQVICIKYFCLAKCLMIFLKCLGLDVVFPVKQCRVPLQTIHKGDATPQNHPENIKRFHDRSHSLLMVSQVWIIYCLNIEGKLLIIKKTRRI